MNPDDDGLVYAAWRVENKMHAFETYDHIIPLGAIASIECLTGKVHLIDGDCITIPASERDRFLKWYHTVVAVNS